MEVCSRKQQPNPLRDGARAPSTYRSVAVSISTGSPPGSLEQRAHIEWCVPS
jgi:hypothetical protein